MDSIAAVRKIVNQQVKERERGLCIVCGKRGWEVHEIIQRSHHAKSKQVEMGTFTLENCVLVCRKCHDDIGQTQFGETLFTYLLHAKYGYKRPSLL